MVRPIPIVSHREFTGRWRCCCLDRFWRCPVVAIEVEEAIVYVHPFDMPGPTPRETQRVLQWRLARPGDLIRLRGKGALETGELVAHDLPPVRGHEPPYPMPPPASADPDDSLPPWKQNHPS